MNLFRFFSVVIVSFIIFLPSCGSESSNADPDMGDIIGNSIIDLPESLAGTRTTSRGSSCCDPCDCEEAQDSMIGIYQGIRCYVRIAENVKSGVKDIIKGIVRGLPYLPVDTEIPIDNPNDDLKRVLVEKPEGTEYEWKVSFFYTESGDVPEMIVRFSILGNWAKGRILWKFVEEDEELAEAEMHQDVTHALDVSFDGTTDIKTLEVRYTQDLEYILDPANLNTLNEIDDDWLKGRVFGQPEKIFLNASLNKNTDEYTIYGTSYHPGWHIIEKEIFGENRNIYLFKAKAKRDGNQLAKLYLSLPLNTRDTIDDVWTADGVGVVLTDFLTSNLNQIIGRLLDNEDDDDLEDPFQGSIADEQSRAYDIVSWITGADPESAGYSITREQLENYVFDPSSDSDDFKNSYKSIKYILNPAFYSRENGFLGTYDEGRDEFYTYIPDSLTPIGKPANFDEMYALDLSGIQPYVPTEVVSATITVE